MEIPESFLGYKRENGRAGTRNHVIILPVDDISNAFEISSTGRIITWLRVPARPFSLLYPKKLSGISIYYHFFVFTL